MSPEIPRPNGTSLAKEAMNQADALAALQGNPMTRVELVAALDVSRTTVHRTVQALDARDLLVKQGGNVELSVYGEAVADEVATYRRGISAASHLKPFMNTISELSADFDVGLFNDAHLSETTQMNPYAPIMRFMTLLRHSESLRVFDTSTVNPIYAEEIRDAILDGMDTDAIYPPAVVDNLSSTYPATIETLLESGHLTLSTHDDLPFGLAIFDDRIGLGGYDLDSGLLRAFIDTDDPAARAWAVALFDSYRGSADSGEPPPG